MLLLSRIFWLLVFLFLAALPIEFLNFSGFCYREGRYLSEKELIGQFLLHEPWRKNDREEYELKQKILSMTPQEKEKKITENWERNFGCCRVHDNLDWH